MNAMDDSAPSQLPAHPAFAGLSHAGAERLQQQLSGVSLRLVIPFVLGV